MTINIKNLSNKSKLSKMGEFQNLKQIEGLCQQFQLICMEMVETI